MPPAALNLAGRKFVVLPEREYLQLKAKAAQKGNTTSARHRNSDQERGDIAESLRRLSNPRRAPADQVFKKMGI